MSEELEGFEGSMEVMSEEEARKKISEIIDDQKKELIKYSIPVKVFSKSLQQQPESKWWEMRKLEDQMTDFEIEIEKRKLAVEEGQLDAKEGNKLVADMEEQFNKFTATLFPVILSDDSGQVYGVYVQGADIRRLKTVGGKVFNEVAEEMEQMGVYNPKRI